MWGGGGGGGACRAQAATGTSMAPRPQASLWLPHTLTWQRQGGSPLSLPAAACLLVVPVTAGNSVARLQEEADSLVPG